MDTPMDSGSPALQGEGRKNKNKRHYKRRHKKVNRDKYKARRLEKESAGKENCAKYKAKKLSQETSEVKRKAATTVHGPEGQDTLYNKSPPPRP